jgi:hypothetical protein
MLDKTSADGRRPIGRYGLACGVVAVLIVSAVDVWTQVPGSAGHDHLTEVACVDVLPGEKRPEFGCFNVGTVSGLRFTQGSVYWHLHTFLSRKAADAAKSPTGIVVEGDGECGCRNSGSATVRRGAVNPSSSWGLCSCPQRRAMRRFSRTPSCGPATVPECTRIRA